MTSVIKDTTRHFFNQVAFDEYPWTEETIEKDSKIILDKINAIAENVNSLNFYASTSTWAASMFTPRLSFQNTDNNLHGLAYVAESGTHIIEVLDLPPYRSSLKSERRNQDVYNLKRIIALHNKDGALGQKGTVCIELFPDRPPFFSIMSGDMFVFEESSINNASPTSTLIEVVDKITTKINQSIPNPDWVKDFDQNFEIDNFGIFKKEL